MGRYEDYFIHEIIPYVETHYHALSDRSARYIGGASAGGYASIHYGLKHPELFSRIGGHMPAVEINLDSSDLEARRNFTLIILWNLATSMNVIKLSIGILMPEIRMREVLTNQ